MKTIETGRMPSTAYADVIDESGNLVARFFSPKDQPEKCEQEARLSIAAPEMLAALELIREAFVHKAGDEKGNKARTAPLKHCNEEFSAALNAGRTAITAAKGTL